MISSQKAEARSFYPDMPMTMVGTLVPSLTMHQLSVDALRSLSSKRSCSKIGVPLSLTRFINGALLILILNPLEYKSKQGLLVKDKFFKKPRKQKKNVEKIEKQTKLETLIDLYQISIQTRRNLTLNRETPTMDVARRSRRDSIVR